MRAGREALVALFCEEHRGADAVNIAALQGDHVLDIAEFRSEWGPDRTAGVLEWADRAPGDALQLTAYNESGPRLGCDRSWERVGEALVLPSWPGDLPTSTMAVSMEGGR